VDVNHPIHKRETIHVSLFRTKSDVVGMVVPFLHMILVPGFGDSGKVALVTDKTMADLGVRERISHPEVDCVSRKCRHR
jgi:hypothetical protein